MIVTSCGMRMGLFVLVWIVSVVSSTELSRVLKATNEFAVFGLPVKPTWHAVIMKEHRRLSRSVHPDRACKWDDTECTRRATSAMQRINHARDVLGDPLAQLDVIEDILG